jgi:hypothetical protein
LSLEQLHQMVDDLLPPYRTAKLPHGRLASRQLVWEVGLQVFEQFNCNSGGSYMVITGGNGLHLTQPILPRYLLISEKSCHSVT